MVLVGINSYQPSLPVAMVQRNIFSSVSPSTAHQSDSVTMYVSLSTVKNALFLVPWSSRPPRLVKKFPRLTLTDFFELRTSMTKRHQRLEYESKTVFWRELPHFLFQPRFHRQPSCADMNESDSNVLKNTTVLDKVPPRGDNNFNSVSYWRNLFDSLVLFTAKQFLTF
jgi:hypothetical protein